jgi:prevent-host-death family protein
MAQYNVHEAKTQLSSLLERVEAGEEVVIARNGKPIARLVSVREHQRPPRVLGQFAGQPFRIADDFDELPADIQAAFEGADP